MASPSPPVLERFPPTSGRWLGVATLALLAVVAGFVLADGQITARLGLLVGLAAVALVSWVVLVRPTVHAREDHLLLRNLVRDTEVPWHLVEHVRASQTLRVTVGDRVHHGVAVGRSARADVRAQRNRSGQQPSESPHPSPDYLDYVVDRITRLASEQAAASADRPSVTHRWARVELLLGLVLALAGVALWLS